MITNKDFESNCKRIAKEIQKECNNPTSDAVCFGRTTVDISSELYHVFNMNPKGYMKSINNLLKGCSVKLNGSSPSDLGMSLTFDVEFDD